MKKKKGAKSLYKKKNNSETSERNRTFVLLFFPFVLKK